MIRALYLIPLIVIIAAIDAPIQQDTIADIQQDKLIADYVYIYAYDGRIKTSCRTGEYIMPEVGEWYALENETYVITNVHLVWCDDMELDDITLAVYCKRLKQ